MQRFRIAGLYTVGVAVIMVLAVWGASLRLPARARAAMSPNLPQTSATNGSPHLNGAGPAVAPGKTPTEGGGVAKVSVDNFLFVPEELTITAGTTVTWVNTDEVPHTASSTAKPSVFDSKALDTDDKYSFLFRTPGVYEYYCKVHPHMIGKIIVK